MATAFSSISDSRIDIDCWDDQEEPVVTLCGRTGEAMQLLDAYHRVCTNHTSEVIVVHGESGSDLGIQEPYSAVMAAFSDLCDLVSQSDDFEKRKLKIQQDIGHENGLWLSRTISHLSPFLSSSNSSTEEEDAPNIKEGNALAKFTIACKGFLRAMTSSEHPVVLVLDDIQWMDMGSRQLLEVLLSDAELQNVLLVLIYRDEEEGELALDSLKALKSSSLRKTDVHVTGFDVGGIHQIVLSRYKIEASEKSEALSLLIHQRTCGNAFYIIGFLDYIESEGLLAIEIGIDVDDIKQETMVVDTIADVLLTKIHRLPSEVHETLKIASLLGFRFEKELIANVMSRSYSIGLLTTTGRSDKEQADEMTVVSVSASLENAADHGIIEKTSDGYQFCHDKFQSCFRSTIGPSVEPHIHKLIGQTLLESDSPTSRYHAAVHLNRALGPLVKEGFDLTELARINLKAAKYCKNKSFFFEAAQLLKVALNLVPDGDKWEKTYHLTLEISALLATMMQCAGEMSDSRRISQSILDNAKTIEDKLGAITQYFTALGIESKLGESNQFCLKSLRDLGVVVPSKVSLFHLVYKLVQVNRALATRSDDDIMNSLAVTDKSKSTIISLLSAISSASLILQGKEKEGAYFALLALQMTLQEGLSPHSSLAFATYSAMLMGFRKYDKALRYGELAMQIGQVHRCSGSLVSDVIVTSLISHWSQPLVSFSERLDQSAKHRLQFGETSPHIATLLWFRLLAGEHLDQMERLHKSMLSKVRDLQRNDTATLWLITSYQYVLNLRSESASSWRNSTELTGSIMKESEVFACALKAAEGSLLTVLWTFKLQLEFHFGFHSAAEKTFENLKPYVLTTALAYHMHAVMIVAFIGSLNFYAQSRERMQKQNLRKARRYKRHIEKLKIGSRPNILPLIAILEAEDLSHLKKTDSEVLAKRFDKAIEANATAGFVHMEALANERAGFAFGHRCDRRRAEAFFERAINLHADEWGAVNKAAWLRENSDQILNRLKKADVPAQEFLVGDIIQVGPPDMAGGHT